MPNKCISCLIFFSCINCYYFNPFFSFSSLSLVSSLSPYLFLYLSLSSRSSLPFLFLFSYISLFLFIPFFLLSFSIITKFYSTYVFFFCSSSPIIIFFPSISIFYLILFPFFFSHSHTLIKVTNQCLFKL